MICCPYKRKTTRNVLAQRKRHVKKVRRWLSSSMEEQSHWKTTLPTHLELLASRAVRKFPLLFCCGNPRKLIWGHEGRHHYSHSLDEETEAYRAGPYLFWYYKVASCFLNFFGVRPSLHTLVHCFPSRGDFALQEHLAMSRDIFVSHNKGRGRRGVASI